MGPASDLLALDPKATHMAPSLCEAGSVPTGRATSATICAEDDHMLVARLALAIGRAYQAALCGTNHKGQRAHYQLSRL